MNSCLFVLSNPQRTAAQIRIGRYLQTTDVPEACPDMVYFEKHPSRAKALWQRDLYTHLPSLLLWSKIRRCNPKLSTLGQSCSSRPRRWSTKNSLLHLPDELRNDCHTMDVRL